MVAARLQLEKDYKTAMQKQDQKIELAMRMYDLVSRHIERLDSQVMTKSNLNKSDWIRKGPQQKRLDGGIRKRYNKWINIKKCRKKLIGIYQNSSFVSS